MAEYEWKSDEEKFEAIGFLAIPNVIKSIEVQVPENLLEKFKMEYKGKYSGEYPYVVKEGSKRGYQFRITLNDVDGCPESITELLDTRYGNRINNSGFIKELVQEYGFRFTNVPQDSRLIMDSVFKAVGRPLYNYFQKGLYSNRDFLKNMDAFLKDAESYGKPNILEYKEQSLGKTKKKGSKIENDRPSALRPKEMLMLGWNGEEYIAHLLKEHDKDFLKAIGVSPDEDYTFEWFNDGFLDAEDEDTVVTTTDGFFIFEFIKKWEDKSVGEGCDIRLTTESGEIIDIEVKTSRGTYPFFNMTSVEMQEMEKMGKHYFLVKVNNFGRLLKCSSPDIIVINNPFDKLFHPKQMKEATFVIGGK